MQTSSEQGTDNGGRPPLLSAVVPVYNEQEAVSRVKIPADTGDSRLLSRRAVECLGLFREQHRFMKGLYSWIGYPQKEVLYRRGTRYPMF